MTGFAYFVGLMSLQTAFTLKYGYTGSVAEFYSFQEVLAELAQTVLYTTASDVLFVALVLSSILVWFIGRLQPAGARRSAWILLVAGAGAHIVTVLAANVILSVRSMTPLLGVAAFALTVAFLAPLVMVAFDRPRLPLPIRLGAATVIGVGFFYFAVLVVGLGMPQRWVYADVECSDRRYEHVVYIKSFPNGYLVFDGRQLLQLPSATVHRIAALATPIRGGFYVDKRVYPGRR